MLHEHKKQNIQVVKIMLTSYVDSAARDGQLARSESTERTISGLIPLSTYKFGKNTIIPGKLT